MKRKMMNLRMVVILVAIMAFASPAVASDIHTAWTDLYDWVEDHNFGCQSCHDMNEPVCDPLLGLYGCDVADELAGGADGYGALMNVESFDSDLDGYNNITEIVDLTFPGNAENHPDSTINITLAEYDDSKGKVVIRATSDHDKDADLEVLNFGPMKWKRKNSYWEFVIRRVQTPPRYVTVCGIMEDCISDVVQ